MLSFVYKKSLRIKLNVIYSRDDFQSLKLIISQNINYNLSNNINKSFKDVLKLLEVFVATQKPNLVLRH